MTDLASLGISIETAEVKTGSAELDKLTAAAVRTEAAVEKLGPASAEAASEIKKVSAGAATVGPAIAQQAQQFQAAGLSAKQYAQALRQVPAQITDIVTQLAGGQNPFLIAIQQGGQLRDVFGGFGAALRGLATVLTPVRLAFAGVAGVVALAAKGFFDGQRESFEFAKAIALSGNAAGVTASQLRLLAHGIDGIAGTEALAVSALAKLAGTGKVAGDDLERLALVAVKVQRSVGAPIEDTVKQFAELGRDPVAASKKLNEQYNFLTASVLRQIRALEDQGRVFEAGQVAQGAFADNLDRISKETEANLGSLQRFGRGVADVFKEARDALLDIGRDRTIDDRIEELQKLVSAGVTRTAGRGGFDPKAALEQVAAIKQTQIILAQADAARIVNEKTFIALDEKQFAKKKELAAQAEQLRKTQVTFDIDGIKKALDSQVSALSNSENELQALHAAGLVKDQEFFDRRRALIEETTASQVKALQEQNERLRKENTSGVAQIMNQQMIRDNETAIGRLRDNSISQLKVLQTQQESATRKITLQYEEARAAAEAFLKTLDKQFQRQIELQGAGTKARDREGQRNQLNDRFDAQRQSLQGELRRDEITKENFDRQLALIDEFNAKALNSQDKFFTRLDENQSSFFIGAREAINNYIDDASNFSKATEGLLTHAFTGAEDALVKFVTTGKASFKDLANSILADLIRIQIRAIIVRAIAGSGILGGGASAGSTGGLGAGGGSVGGGGTLFADVGIRRVPKDNQLAILHKDEAVIPAKMNPFAGGSFGGNNTSVNVRSTLNAAPGVSQSQLQQILNQRDAQLKSDILDGMRRGRF